MVISSVLHTLLLFRFSRIMKQIFRLRTSLSPQEEKLFGLFDEFIVDLYDFTLDKIMSLLRLSPNLQHLNLTGLDLSQTTMNCHNMEEVR